jgi:hypothetical protein
MPKTENTTPRTGIGPWRLLNPGKARMRPRHKQGEMNGSETRYSQILNLRLEAGDLQAWYFERIKLRLADNTYLNIDFMTIDKDGYIILDEVKGHWEDDARVKMKVAAEMYPMFTFRAVKLKSVKTMEYEIEEFKSDAYPAQTAYT